MTRIIVLWAALTACAPHAEIEQWCDVDLSLDAENPEVCLPCETDADCVIQGNPCSEIAYCDHVDQQIPVAQLWCPPAQERIWPEDSECVCVQSECVYEG